MARGRLRVYLGAAPGVGKTHAMLDEAQRRAGRGTDVVIGVLDCAGRHGIEAMVRGLEHVPTTSDGELDVDAVSARRPAIVLVDDLAHRPADPGVPARWESVEALLAAGIEVITTISITNLESLRDVVTEITGVPPDETVPDHLVRAADQIELVDMTPEALRRRLAHGHVYPPERVDAALANLFRPAVLGALRQLALLWMAERVEEQLQRDRGPHAAGDVRERVVVALGGEGGDHLVRRAARLAGRTGGQLIGVHVVRAGHSPGPDLEHQRQLLVELGGVYREVIGDDVAEALSGFVKVEQATQLVIGAQPVATRPRGPSVVDQLVRSIGPVDVHVSATTPATTVRQSAGHRRTARPKPARRAAWLLCLAGPPLLTLILVSLRRHVSVGTALLLDLCIVLGAATLGGLWPGLVASLLAFILTNWYLTPPLHKLNIGASQNVVAFTVFVLVTVVVSVLVDRAARRAFEASQARAEAEALARSAATLVGAHDPLPELLEQVRATFGLQSASVLERTPDGWWPTHTSGRPELLAPEDGTSIDLSPDGDLCLVVSHGAQHPNQHGALHPEQLEVLRAFADQLAMAVQARRLRAEAANADLLVEANALRSALLQAVSHDFRTPLSTIRAAATGLLNTEVAFSEEDQRALLSEIDDAAARLDRMVRNLLDMSRIQAGALELDLQPVALEEVVAAALSTTNSRGRVSVDVPDTLPLVHADAALLERALANLVSNAIAWSPQDLSVRVEAGLVAGAVDLRVIDRGPGVPIADREAMFQPFQRFGDRSVDAGAGLGLAIARGFVEAMGATLDADDTPGSGLTMTIRLPVVDVDTLP